MNSENIVSVYAYESVGRTIYDSLYQTASTRFVCIGMEKDGEGYLGIYETDHGKVKKIDHTTHEAPLRCGKSVYEVEGKGDIVTGDFDGQICLWDCNRLSFPKSCFDVSEKMVNSLDVCQDENTVVSGCRDGRMVLWDMRSKSIAHNIKRTEDQAKQGVECWAVAANKSAYGTVTEPSLVAFGQADGNFDLFDVRKGEIVKTQKFVHGICSIEFSRGESGSRTCAASCTNSELYILDLANVSGKGLNSQLLNRHEGSTIWRARYLPQERKSSDILLTVGGDGFVCVNKISRTKKSAVEVNLLNSEQISSQPITSLDFNSDKRGLFVCSSFEQKVYSCFVTDV